MWTRPTPDRDADFIKPSYVPGPSQTPMVQPGRRESSPIYAPTRACGPSAFLPWRLLVFPVCCCVGNGHMSWIGIGFEGQAKLSIASSPHPF